MSLRGETDLSLTAIDIIEEKKIGENTRLDEYFETEGYENNNKVSVEVL